MRPWSMMYCICWLLKFEIPILRIRPSSTHCSRTWKHQVSLQLYQHAVLLKKIQFSRPRTGLRIHLQHQRQHQRQNHGFHIQGQTQGLDLQGQGHEWVLNFQRQGQNQWLNFSSKAKSTTKDSMLAQWQRQDRRRNFHVPCRHQGLNFQDRWHNQGLNFES